jgi:hypothetical protein
MGMNKSELGLVVMVHEGYIAWVILGQNKLTVQMYRNLTTV